MSPAKEEMSLLSFENMFDETYAEIALVVVAV